MITTLKTAPTTYALTAAEVETHLYIIDDTSYEDYLDTLIAAATAWTEEYLQRKLITQTWYVYCDGFPAGPLTLPFGDLQSVTAIKYTDVDDTEDTLSSANYYVDTDSTPGRVVLKDGEVWPSVTLRPMNPVEVEFVTGFGAATAVPDSIKHAMKMLIGHWFEHRESVVITNMINVHNMPFAVTALLYPHRMWRWVS